MAKQGEMEYLRKLSGEGIAHALEKPFSDPACGGNLMQIGAVLSLMPPPPSRVLDVGCGTGWTSLFLARRGHEVVGVDICADAIDYANQSKRDARLDNVRFVVGDYEDMVREGTFDGALFYDSLHHAVDHEAALRSVCDCLRMGGTCITSEPGLGHKDSPDSQAAMRDYGVTEEDMPPAKIIAAGKKAGFRYSRVYPHARDLEKAIYAEPYHPKWAKWGERGRYWVVWTVVNAILLRRQRQSGMVMLVK